MDALFPLPGVEGLEGIRVGRDDRKKNPIKEPKSLTMGYGILEFRKETVFYINPKANTGRTRIPRRGCPEPAKTPSPK